MNQKRKPSLLSITSSLKSIDLFTGQALIQKPIINSLVNRGSRNQLQTQIRSHQELKVGQTVQQTGRQMSSRELHTDRPKLNQITASQQNNFNKRRPQSVKVNFNQQQTYHDPDDDVQISLQIHNKPRLFNQDEVQTQLKRPNSAERDELQSFQSHSARRFRKASYIQSQTLINSQGSSSQRGVSSRVSSHQLERLASRPDLGVFALATGRIKPDYSVEQQIGKIDPYTVLNFDRQRQIITQQLNQMSSAVPPYPVRTLAKNRPPLTNMTLKSIPSRNRRPPRVPFSRLNVDLVGTINDIIGKENQPESNQYQYYMQQVKTLNQMKQNLQTMHQQGLKSETKLKLINSVRHMERVVETFEKRMFELK